MCALRRREVRGRPTARLVASPTAQTSSITMGPALAFDAAEIQTLAAKIRPEDPREADDRVRVHATDPSLGSSQSWWRG
jgi:hypothetical protein